MPSGRLAPHSGLWSLRSSRGSERLAHHCTVSQGAYGASLGLPMPVPSHAAHRPTLCPCELSISGPPKACPCSQTGGLSPLLPWEWRQRLVPLLLSKGEHLSSLTSAQTSVHKKKAEDVKPVITGSLAL